MPATPTLTPSELAAGYQSGVRIGVALREIRRRIELELPPYIDYINDALSLQNELTIEQFDGYYLAPRVLSGKHRNCVLVGASVRKEPLGTKLFRNVADVTVYCLNERAEAEEQLLLNYDRSELIGHVLAPYLCGCYDQSSRMCWRLLKPVGQIDEWPQAWKEHSGVALRYELKQNPADNLWTAA